MQPILDLLDAYRHAFMVRATLAALLVAVTCSVISFFVVMRRMAFIGAGISHIAFGGVALALLLGLPVGAGAIVFGVGAALILGEKTARRTISEDTLIGILFATAMAFGVIFAQYGGASRVDLTTFLFGNVLTVSDGELIGIAVLGIAVVAILAGLFPALLFASYDEDAAAVSGLPVDRLHRVLLVLIAFTVVMSIRAVGLLLVAALLVIPGAVALLFPRSLRAYFAISLAVGVASTVGGMVVSYYIDKPTGAVTVLFASVILAVAFFLRPRHA
jgi:ABC-type Mn2+/Zn2+ transport system permease subunit